MNLEHLSGAPHQEKATSSKKQEGVLPAVESVTALSEAVISGCSEKITRCGRSSKVRAPEFRERYQQLQDTVLQGIRAATLALATLTPAASAFADDAPQVGSKSDVEDVVIEKNQPIRTAFNSRRSAIEFLRELIDKHDTQMKVMEHGAKHEDDFVSFVNGANLELFRPMLRDRIEYYQNIIDTLHPSSIIHRPAHAFNEWRRVFGQRQYGADVGRQWIANVVHSPEYVRKLSEEGATSEEIKTRQERSVQDVVFSAPIRDALGVTTLPVDTEILKNNVTLEQIQAVESVYPDGVHDAVTIDVDGHQTVGEIAETSVHEMHHYVTKGPSGITEYAQKLYAEAFDPMYLSHNPFYIQYISMPTEMDAHKKGFEYEFEKLSDWKYGDEFTDEHEKKVFELLEQDKFREGTKNFLRSIKKGYLQKIMNELAHHDVPRDIETKNIS